MCNCLYKLCISGPAPTHGVNDGGKLSELLSCWDMLWFGTRGALEGAEFCLLGLPVHSLKKQEGRACKMQTEADTRLWARTWL